MGMNQDYIHDYKVDPLVLPKVYQNLVNRLAAKGPGSEAGENGDNTARSFGVLAGYVSEAIAPGAMASSTDLDPEIIYYNGHQDVGDIQKRPMI